MRALMSSVKGRADAKRVAVAPIAFTVLEVALTSSKPGGNNERAVPCRRVSCHSAFAFS